MSKFMKMLNNISRSQAVFRRARVAEDDLQACQYAFVLAICNHPGRSQEELAEELCLNKSTITRSLAALEERDYITRTPLPSDKRRFAVHPTARMLAVLPQIKAASAEWMALLSEGISEEELAVFDSVLARMQAKAKAILDSQEENA